MKSCVSRIIGLLLILCACSPEEPQPEPTPTGRPTARPVVAKAVTPLPTRTVTPSPLCPLPDLEWGQHISSSGSYTQTETSAAGPMVCRVARNSCAYRKLVSNRDPDILFSRHKPPPLDVEDTLMHPAILLPLSRLKDLVEKEWGGKYKLLVTAAYDSEGEHDLAQSDTNRKYALHFEGRSIDFVVYPVDRTRYARLCALAHCAGFDWVHNEGDHCHASIKAPSVCSMCSGSN